MIDADKRQAVFLLHQEGMERNRIARQLRISPNTVEAIVQQKGEMPVHPRKDKIRVDADLLKRLYQECDGYAQRVHEKLVEDEHVQIQYSTVTRLLRELGLGRGREPRCDRVPDEPGAEMQHDTSVYSIPLGSGRVKLVASLLYLRYSKRRYLRFYRSFNRFRMKCFLHEALMFWQHAAPVCIRWRRRWKPSPNSMDSASSVMKRITPTAKRARNAAFGRWRRTSFRDGSSRIWKI